MNAAIRNKEIIVTPGLTSVRIAKLKEGIGALAPGLFTEKALEDLAGGRAIGPLATVDGQWIPPGVTVKLTPRETDELIDALILGSFAAVVSILETFGVDAAVAVPVATALIAVAGIVKICKELSATGAVGFKFTAVPWPTVTPYPV